MKKLRRPSTGNTKNTKYKESKTTLNFYLDWHNTSVTQVQVYVADASNVSRMFYKNSISLSLEKWSLNKLTSSAGALE